MGTRERRGLTFAGMSRARSGMCRSPMTRTRREVMMAAEWLVRVLGTLSCAHWLGEGPAHPIAWSAASHSSIEAW